MKKKSFIIATALLVGCSFAQAQDSASAANPAPAEAQAEAKPEKKMSQEEVTKTIGYVFGYRTGMNMAQSGPIQVEDFDKEAFMKGLADGLKSVKLDMPNEDMEAAYDAYEAVIKKRIDEANKKNIEEGKKFLEEVEKEEGVVKTKSGLLYKVLEKGGDKKYEAPKGGNDMGTQFKVKYKGTLPNGEVFDETGDEAITMPMQVIEGFKEALTTMPVGAKWKLYIPSELAYGERSPGGVIGPNQTLIFELELLEIIPPDPNQPQMPQLSAEQLQALMGGAQMEMPSQPVKGEDKASSDEEE